MLSHSGRDGLSWRAPRQLVRRPLAVRIGELLTIPHVEIDALFHGPAWTPRETFAAEVKAFSAEPNWVTEWQYSTVRALLAERADLLVWLDVSRAAVMRRVVRRTVRRRLRRQVLWNGNIEPPLWTVFTRAHRALGLVDTPQDRPTSRCRTPAAP